MRPHTLRQLYHFLTFDFEKDAPISHFNIDSRTIKPNEVYVALKGEKVDGHQFLPEVKEKGAIAAIVSKNYQGPSCGLILIYVDDPLTALQNLARKSLSLHKARIVAVTGSVGKTSTKEFIAAMLRTRFKVAASPGNSNSQVGVPLAILNHTQGNEDIVVLEMGMTQPGHIKNLVSIAPPEVALLTTVALVHACSFDSIEEIARTKAEIFSHPFTKLGIMPYEMPDRTFIESIGNFPKYSFSLRHPEADYFMVETASNHVFDRKEERQIELGPINLMGKHNRHNILAAAIVARYFDIPWGVISQTIRSLELPEKRLQVVEKKGILFVNDSYNAAEISVKAALDALPTPIGKGKKIAVLGSMMELGKFSDECHRSVGRHALNLVDQVYCFGVECRPILEVWNSAKKPANLFLDQSEMINKLRCDLKAGDVVLLKGSRSKQLWKVLEEI